MKRDFSQALKGVGGVALLERVGDEDKPIVLFGLVINALLGNYQDE
jgi:hypothetical protein